MSDVEVLAAIRHANESKRSPLHKLAGRIQCRQHFRLFYEASPNDKAGGKLVPGKVLAAAAEREFGPENIRHDQVPPKASAPDFPVRRYDGKVESSLSLSRVLAAMPVIEIDSLYCDGALLSDTIKWRDARKNALLKLH